MMLGQMTKGFLAQAEINLKLTYRDRTVIFFNYLFPLIFFFIFAQMFHAEQGGAIIQVLTMVPVSYTHLDVYKRQVLKYASLRWKWNMEAATLLGNSSMSVL